MLVKICRFIHCRRFTMRSEFRLQIATLKYKFLDSCEQGQMWPQFESLCLTIYNVREQTVDFERGVALSIFL